MPSLKYFQSVNVEDTKTHEAMSQLETILQSEHGIDGKHPLASGGQHGFMSAEDKQKLDAIWLWIQSQSNPPNIKR